MDFILVTTSNTYDIKNKRQIVGGVQTYTRDLCLLAKENGFNVKMYQIISNQEEAVADFDGIEFHVVNMKGKNNQSAFNEIYKKLNAKEALFVIGTDQANIRSREKNVIVIQHGIAFDCPIEEGFWSKTRFLQHTNKMMRCIRNVQRLYMSRNTVCVDYNYFNWIRTLGMIYPGKKVQVIPNYSSGRISKECFDAKMESYNSEGVIKIVFARRFVAYRGTEIIANCIERILPQFPNVEFTLAGGGDLEEDLKKRFVGNPRVIITSFEAPESIEFHKKFDIAVVPTIYSEGTSLSLLEAMSAGCFPIASHVGGMTNIILDHFNGLLCYPDEDGVYKALLDALNMEEGDFRRIATNAYKSAVEAFSLDQWKKRWTSFLTEVAADSFD